MSQLAGKTVIITGSSRGVGADTAQILAAQGANIIVNYRSKAPRANKVVKAIEEAGYKVKVTSNGENGARHMKLLADAGVSKINFSIFGTTPEELSIGRYGNWYG